MTEYNSIPSYHSASARRRERIRRARRGQTLVIALAVLFALLLIGGVFVTFVARNLAASARSRDTQGTQALAEAGIRYCDEMLTNSEDGADWRPNPTAPITTPADPNGYTDPDYQWLSKGFTRLSFPGGRALVRLVYDPQPGDPRSQLLRVEAIGRSGDLAQGLDPTVFVQRGFAPQLRRELVAYKQIGLTDYLMYVTNKDRRAQEQFLGIPAIGASAPGSPAAGLDPAMVFGDPSMMLHVDTAGNPTGLNGNEFVIGGGIRVNGNLRIGGNTHFYFSPRGTTTGGQPNTSPESLLVSGNISLLPTQDLNNANGTTDGVLSDNDLQVFVNHPYDMATNSLDGLTPNTSYAIRASTDPAFSTVNGLVRDGSQGADTQGYTRGVPRLDPPRIDTFANATGVRRYRAVTRESGFWSGNFNTGQLGYGTGIYVNNQSDRQIETSTPGVVGGYSLRSDWLNNSGTARGYWRGPFYRPPGLSIELLGNKIRLTREDGQVFLKPDGSPVNGSGGTGGAVLEIPLANAARKRFTFPDGTSFSALVGRDLPELSHDGDVPGAVPARPYGDSSSYGVSVTLLAEGNIRIKGVYGAVTDPNVKDETLYDPNNPNENYLKLGRVHLTVVTGGTAYFEGNLVKGDGYVSGGKVHLERASTCAVLAMDYACINTTAFQAPVAPTSVWTTSSPDLTDFYTTLGVGSSTASLDMRSSFGVPVDSYTSSSNASPLFLMVRHGMQLDNSNGGQTFINLLVNPAGGTGASGAGSSALYQFGRPGLPPETYALYDVVSSGAPNFERRAFDLRNAAGGANPPTFVSRPGYDNIFRFQLDQAAPSIISAAAPGGGPSGLVPSAEQDYLFGGAVVTPLDIRIEALIYAQERSFFVIPGYGFNPDPNDTMQNFMATGIRPSYTADERRIVQQGGAHTAEMMHKDLFPFYGQPLDVRITVCGAVTQNYTAGPGDQAAWLSRWGYIPTEYGNSKLTIPDDHVAVHSAVVNNGNLDVNYGYAQDRTGDYRTYLQKQQKITQGLRFEYDPALGLPYNRPTSVPVYDSSDTRTAAALRTLASGYSLTLYGANVNATFKQTLPAIPKLPVCPGLLYFGDAEKALVP